MNALITALQFLTRIRICRDGVFSPEICGRSVYFFPLVGAVIGLILFGFNYIVAGRLPVNVSAALLLALEIVITGGLHCDGLMDTMDGIFSGRSRERMLDIMKDSHVGANGVAAFGLYLLIKYSLLVNLISADGAVLLVMPVLGRFAMVIAITCFPYARNEGLGKAFADFAGKKALLLGGLLTVILSLPFGLKTAAGLLVVSGFTVIFGHYVSRRLGGLTGDVYGAVTEIAEVIVLAVFLLAGGLQPAGIF